MKKPKKKIPPGGPAPHVLLAVIYCRVSSREQSQEGYSLEGQDKLLREYAAAKGMVVIREYVEIQSAKRAGRSKFVEMLDFLESCDGPTPVILVERTDRLTRNLSDMAALSDRYYTIHFVKENRVIGPHSSPNDWFMWGVSVLMAKQQIDQLGEVVTKGMTQKAESGMYPSNAPVGYRNFLGADGKRAIAPDPLYGPFVRMLFERYAQGGVSIRQLTKYAKDDGFVSPITHKPFTRSSIQTILKRQTYCGWYAWNQKIHKGTYTPLVTLEVWETVQHLLNSQGMCHERPRAHDHAYAGMLRCGHTNAVLTGDRKKGRYTYYTPGRYDGPGKRPYVREEVITQKFADVLKELCFSEAMLDDLKTVLRASHADQLAFHKERVARLEGERTKLKDRLGVLLDKHLDDEIPSDLFKEKSKQITTEIHRLSAELNRHETASVSYYEDGIALLELARGAYDLYSEQSAADGVRLLKMLCSNCIWKDGNMHVTLHEPFEALRVRNKAEKTEEAVHASADGPRQGWLAHLDSNQENQNQNLVCYQLHHGPVAGRLTHRCKAARRGALVPHSPQTSL